LISIVEQTYLSLYQCHMKDSIVLASVQFLHLEDIEEAGTVHLYRLTPHCHSDTLCRHLV